MLQHCEVLLCCQAPTKGTSTALATFQLKRTWHLSTRLQERDGAVLALQRTIRFPSTPQQQIVQLVAVKYPQSKRTVARASQI